MGWESSDVRFDLWLLLQGQTMVLRFGELSFRWIQICIGSPMHRSSFGFGSEGTGKSPSHLCNARDLPTPAESKDLVYMHDPFKGVHAPCTRLFSIHAFVKSETQVKQIVKYHCFHGDV